MVCHDNMQRIYFANIPLSQELIITEKNLYHQITRVLRARAGQKYIFFDGKSTQDYVYEIQSIDAQKVVFILQETLQKSSGIFPSIHLIQALPNKLEKLEYVIQKACEVGYSSLHFFSSERSQMWALSENKQERLRKIATEATEQCGGNMIPEIHFSWDFSLKHHTNCVSLVCHTQAQDAKILSDIPLQNYDTICVIVGPEGGFSDREIAYFQKQHIQKIYLWNRIFRTETVAPLIWFYLSQKKED